MSTRKKPRPHKSLLGQNLRALQPKLRMIANGDAAVNAIRAEMSAAVKLSSSRMLSKIPQIRGPGHEALSKAEFRQAFKRGAPKPPKLKVLTGQVMTNVFIHTTTSDSLPANLVKESGRRGRIAKATVSLDDLPRLANDKNVRFVEIGEPLKTPQPVVSNATVNAPAMTRAKTTTAARHKGGKDVIIGIIDV